MASNTGASPAGLLRTDRHAWWSSGKAHRHRDSVPPSQPRTARPYGTTSRPLTVERRMYRGKIDTPKTQGSKRAAASPKASSTTSTNGEISATRYPATVFPAKTARRRCGRTMRGTTRSNPSSPSYKLVVSYQVLRRSPPIEPPRREPDDNAPVLATAFCMVAPLGAAVRDRTETRQRPTNQRPRRITPAVEQHLRYNSRTRPAHPTPRWRCVTVAASR
jgi:hypothetical protein